MALFLCQNWTATRVKPADMRRRGRYLASPSAGTTRLPAAPVGGRETWRSSLPGSHHGSDGVLVETGREVSESEAAAMLRQNMVPGHDSRIGFTFTPGAVLIG